MCGYIPQWVEIRGHVYTMTRLLRWYREDYATENDCILY